MIVAGQPRLTNYRSFELIMKTKLEIALDALVKIADCAYSHNSYATSEKAIAKIKAMPDETCCGCDEKFKALEKIYSYRSDKPDWNMVMAIAGDIVDPQELILSGKLEEEF